MSVTLQEAGPRERLLDTADRLFYAEGIHTVGIDRILEESGVAKASLYKYFGNKDGLVRAYLGQRQDRVRERIARYHEAAGDNPRERILAVFDSQAEVISQPNFRGCAFATATAEVARGDELESLAQEYRAYIREMLRTLAEEAGAPNPADLARELHFIYDGAEQAARMDGDSSAATVARRMATVIIGSELKG